MGTGDPKVGSQKNSLRSLRIIGISKSGGNWRSKNPPPQKKHIHPLKPLFLAGKKTRWFLGSCLKTRQSEGFNVETLPDTRKTWWQPGIILSETVPFGSTGAYVQGRTAASDRDGPGWLISISGRKELSDVIVWEIWPQNRHPVWETFTENPETLKSFNPRYAKNWCVFSDSPSFTVPPHASNAWFILYISPCEPRKKTTYCFPLNPGWFIGILIMAYYNPINLD